MGRREAVQTRKQAIRPMLLSLSLLIGLVFTTGVGDAAKPVAGV